jgi:signal transduction histidine kinase
MRDKEERTERDKFHKQFHDQRNELRRKMMELKQQYREQMYEAWKTAYPENPANRYYRVYHRHVRYARPLLLVVMIIFWTVLFLSGGLAAGVRFIAAVFAVLSIMGGISELVVMLRMDSRILHPLAELETAARRIADGDFTVHVNVPFHPETADFVRTFNGMAKSLRKNEQLKREYEENRKELIANISHDLKTPVTAVLGYVDALHDLAPDDREKTERYLSIIRSNTVYLNRLIDDLFLFSKLDIHKLEFHFEKVTVKNFLRDLMEEFSLDLVEHDIRFIYHDMLPEQTAAQLDPKRFCRIVRNIVDNARRYGPSEGLKIEVTAAAEAFPSSEAELPDNMRMCFRLSIADNGSGLPEEKLAHIFERFYRADAERTKNIESTGLGLAIARELVEAHGGTITAENVPSGGLVFNIRIPLSGVQPDSGEEGVV